MATNSWAVLESLHWDLAYETLTVAHVVHFQALARVRVAARAQGFAILTAQSFHFACPVGWHNFFLPIALKPCDPDFTMSSEPEVCALKTKRNMR